MGWWHCAKSDTFHAHPAADGERNCCNVQIPCNIDFIHHWLLTCVARMMKASLIDHATVKCGHTLAVVVAMLGFCSHYRDVIIGAMASQITSITIVYATVYSGADQRKHQSSVSLAFVRGIHLSPVNSPHKESVALKMFPFDDVIMHKSWDVGSLETDIECDVKVLSDWNALNIKLISMGLCKKDVTPVC